MQFFQKSLSLHAANLLLPIAAIVFAFGVFRHKHSNLVSPSGGNDFNEDAISEPAPFDKVIFMVIDALRSDFVYSNKSAFHFTQRLIRSGNAIPFTAHAGPPSLTITRIKAMTQGSNPSFVDVFLNIADDESANALAVEDSWLARMKDKSVGKKMSFYGENTWLQLYPDIFDRYEGIHAFFVPDFTEVDNNVTKHVTSELGKDDWSTLVLHFPGLDHVGHLGGPESPYMPLKQREMDSIVQQIFESIETFPHLQSTLLVLGGDHGMNAKGNHGGSSPGETSSALLVASPRLQALGNGIPCPTVGVKGMFDFYSLIDQSDIVPTLAGLLGFSIPSSSLGVFIPEFLPLWKNRQNRLTLLRENAAQLMRVFMATGASIGRREDGVQEPRKNCTANVEREGSLLYLWQQTLAQDTEREDVLEKLYQFCRQAQKIMSVPHGNLSVFLLFCGISLGLTTLVLSNQSLSPARFLSKRDWRLHIIALRVVAGAHAVTMSFGFLMAHEHLFWYYGALLWLAYIGFKSPLHTNKTFMPALPFTIQLIGQNWNHVGDDSNVDAGWHEYVAHYPLSLWVLIATAYMVMSILLAKHVTATISKYQSLLSWLIASIFWATALAFKLGSALVESPELFPFIPPVFFEAIMYMDLVLCARVVIGLLAVTLMYVLLRLGRTGNPGTQGKALAVVTDVVGLYAMTQSRAVNVPMFLLFIVQLDSLLVTTKLHPLEATLTTLLLSHASFFSLGGSNSIASIDIPLGYNGVRRWSSIGVPLQVMATNWAGPLWWSFAGLVLLFSSLQPPPPPQPKGKRMAKTNSSTNGTLTNGGVGPKSSEGYEELQKARKSELRLVYTDHLAALTTSRALSLLALMIACFRLHVARDPELWITLAPTYVFAVLWCVVVHPLVNVLFCGAVWRIVVA